jgi:hypothetical protein
MLQLFAFRRGAAATVAKACLCYQYRAGQRQQLYTLFPSFRPERSSPLGASSWADKKSDRTLIGSRASASLEKHGPSFAVTAHQSLQFTQPWKN